MRDQGLRGHEWLSAQFAESKALRISQQRVADWHQQHTTYPLHATDADVVEHDYRLGTCSFLVLKHSRRLRQLQGHEKTRCEIRV